jgi:hypothetical protein
VVRFDQGEHTPESLRETSLPDNKGKPSIRVNMIRTATMGAEKVDRARNT